MGLSKSPDSYLEIKDIPTSSDEGTLLDQLFTEHGIDPSRVTSARVSAYQQGQRGSDGESEVLNLGSAAIAFKVGDGVAQDVPEWPVVKQADPVVIDFPQVEKPKRDMGIAVILPDPQIGFRKNVKTGELTPFHDEKAMNVALSITADLNPDKVVNLGDFLDLPNVSRYEQEPAFYATTQASIDAGYRFLAMERAAAPHAEIYLIEGNHDMRLQRFITKNAVAAFGLSRADSPEEWPVLSLPFLMRMDELGIEYVSGYPNAEVYINKGLRCEHGRKHAQRGKIAHKIMSGESTSTITGHNHHVEIAHRTFVDRGETRVVMGATLGCLCRTDGSVPSARTGLDPNGDVITAQMDWQQAIGVVEYDRDGEDFNLTPVIIKNGTAVYNGKIYSAD